MRKILVMALLPLMFLSCGSKSNRPEDTDAVKAAKAEMNRLGDLYHSTTAERVRAQQAGNQAEVDRLTPIECDYCIKANNALIEYYRVLDYERERLNRSR